MKIKFEIRRQSSPNGRSFLQTFDYEYTDPQTTVAAALRELNSREPLFDSEGNTAEPIRWECSCMQKKCGACAMLINKRPCLACDERLSEYGGIIRLEPLKKFPVVADLIVDRQAIFDDLKKMNAWFEGNAEPSEQRSETVHEASRCLQCGCCLEVCPNFYIGTKFMGMAACVPASRLIAEVSESEKKRIFKKYYKHFYAGCGKSLACKDICPAGIDADSLMVNSNAAAVWKRKRK